MSKNEIMVINGKEVPATLVQDVQAVIDRFKASVNNSKAIAETCYNLRCNPEFGKTFAPEVEEGQECKKAFINVVQTLADKAGINLTGASAYKYAQCYELYHSTDYWKYWNIGKMIITSRLEANKNKTHRSTNAFVSWVAFNDNLDRIDKINAWNKANDMQLKKIEALKEKGFDTSEEEKRLTEKPSPAPYVPKDEEADAEYFHTVGMAIIVNYTDKKLKDEVAKYIEQNLTEEEQKKLNDNAGKTDKADKADKADKTDKSSLLDSAIASLTAYTSSLDTVPTELTKALLILKATKGE